MGVKSGLLLSCVLLIAFGFQLVGVLSVPVTRKITLCTFGDYQYGVWGYCQISTNTCSGIRIGYNVPSGSDDFRLPSSARHSLSRLLVVHVVATGVTFIMFLLSLFTYCGKRKFLLALLVLALPSFLVSLLAFLAEVLMFINHLDFAGWFMLAAVVLNALVIVLLCLMRRRFSDRHTKDPLKNNDDMADESAISHFGLVNDRDDEKLIQPVTRTGSHPSNSAGGPSGYQHSFTRSEYPAYGTVSNGPVGSYGVNDASGYAQSGPANSDVVEYPPGGPSGTGRRRRARDDRSDGDNYGTSGPGSYHGPASSGMAPVYGRHRDERSAQYAPNQTGPVDAAAYGHHPRQNGVTGSPAIPAGTYMDGVGSTSSFGPNVVSIPRIRDIPGEDGSGGPDQMQTRGSPQATPRVIDGSALPREDSQRAVMSYMDPNGVDAPPSQTRILPRVPNYSRLTMSPKGGRNGEDSGYQLQNTMPHQGDDTENRGGPPADVAPRRLAFPQPGGKDDLQAPIPSGHRERRVPSGPRPLVSNSGDSRSKIYDKYLEDRGQPNQPAPGVPQSNPMETPDPASSYRDMLPARVSVATVMSDNGMYGGSQDVGRANPTLAQLAAHERDQTPLERFIAQPTQSGPGAYVEPPVNMYAYNRPASPGSEASHFTSVSQRGNVPVYGGPRSAPQHPNRSDFAIDNNPDFSLGLPSSKGRRRQGRF